MKYVDEKNLPILKKQIDKEDVVYLLFSTWPQQFAFLFH